MRNLPAFPAIYDANRHDPNAFMGMDLRDYFAAKAMQALITSRHNDYERGNYDEDVVALNAYLMADAMLAEREGK